MQEINAKHIPIKITFSSDYDLLYLLNSKDESVAEIVHDAISVVVKKDMLRMLKKYDVANSVPDDVFWRTVSAAVSNIKKYYAELYASKYGKPAKKYSKKGETK